MLRDDRYLPPVGYRRRSGCAPDLVCRRGARRHTGTPTDSRSGWIFKDLQSSIDRGTQPLCHRPGTAGFALLREMSMDTANPERTISREVPRSPATDSPSTQAAMSNNPTSPNPAAREQSEQPQSNNLRVSASIERRSGFFSAMFRRLAPFATALVP